MSGIVILANNNASIGILPERGAAMTHYDYVTALGPRSVLQPVEGVASLVLAPWQNRISGGGFLSGGRFVALQANVPGEPFPIHGNAWQKPWVITHQTSDAVSLMLGSDGPEPYRYRADIEYRLHEDGSLGIDLRLTNEGEELPFGLGLHPYFPRTALMTIEAAARSVTLQDEMFLPTQTLAVADRPEMDFSTAKGLPVGLINNEFGGWIGSTEMTWPELRMGCALTAFGITRYLIYSPGASASFFCFEPATHSIDAFNRPDPLGRGGLVMLPTGAAIGLACSFRPHSLVDKTGAPVRAS